MPPTEQRSVRSSAPREREAPSLLESVRLVPRERTAPLVPRERTTPPFLESVRPPRALSKAYGFLGPRERNAFLDSRERTPSSFLESQTSPPVVESVTPSSLLERVRSPL
ncbi:hypothetical protein EV715DRAFT_298218 [Schizophyllum commune]